MLAWGVAIILVICFVCFEFLVRWLWPSRSEQPAARLPAGFGDLSLSQGFAAMDPSAVRRVQETTAHTTFAEALGLLTFDGQTLAGDEAYMGTLTPAECRRVADRLRARMDAAADAATRRAELEAVADAGERTMRLLAAHEPAFVAARRRGVPQATAAVRARTETQKAAERDGVRARVEAGDLTPAEATAIAVALSEQHTSDPQNVHDPAVVDEFADTVARLRERHRPSARDADEAVRWASEHIWKTYGERDSERLTDAYKFLDEYGHNPRERELIALVHQRAAAPENSETADQIGENLARGMAESGRNGLCETGRADNILAALTMCDRGMAGVAEPMRQEEIRNAALTAASEKTQAAAERSAAGGSAAAREYLGLPGSDAAPDERAKFMASLVATGLEAAREAGSAKLRDDARSRLEEDIRLAIML